MERRLEEVEGKNADLAGRLRREANGRKIAKQERDAIEAEMYVRQAAAQSGIKDIDYALRLLTQDLDGKSEEDLEKFNELKFFEGLREKHPYLFGEPPTKPATTGTGAGSAPPTPTPGAAQQGAAQGDQVDAKGMDPKQFREHLAKRGLNLSA